MKAYVLLLFVAALSLCGCQHPRPSDEFRYTIINQERIPGVKRSVDVRLSKKASEDDLKSIALEIWHSDSQSYKRTFICYYLPDMQAGAGAWATTHFTPSLEVRILGLTAEQEKSLIDQPSDQSQAMIGVWLDERPFVASTTTIVRENGKLFMEVRYKDGSSSKQLLKEKKSRLGRRFETVENFGHGDYWILDAKGDLQIRDNEGLIATVKRIR